MLVEQPRHLELIRKRCKMGIGVIKPENWGRILTTGSDARVSGASPETAVFISAINKFAYVRVSHPFGGVLTTARGLLVTIYEIS